MLISIFAFLRVCTVCTTVMYNYSSKTVSACPAAGNPLHSIAT